MMGVGQQEYPRVQLDLIQSNIYGSFQEQELSWESSNLF